MVRKVFVEKRKGIKDECESLKKDIMESLGIKIRTLRILSRYDVENISDALFEKTAKLPRVELIEPGHVICRNTIESMQSGLVYGHMGLVDFIINKMKEECSEMTGNKIEDITVVATGGLATMVSKGVKSIDHVDRLLTLEGLSLIYEKNKNNFGNRNNMSRENIQLRAEE